MAAGFLCGVTGSLKGPNSGVLIERGGGMGTGDEDGSGDSLGVPTLK